MDSTSGHLTVTADQYFLVYFIMGVYFGPDLKKARCLKSIFQRRAEGLLSYLPHQLAGSQMRTVALEGVYYYILRRADESLVLKLPQLHQFFNGDLPAPANDSTISYPQFDSIFSPKLHPKSQFRNKYDVLGNIAFIHEPEISYIKPVDIARFRRLTGLKGFLLDRDDPLLQKFMNGEYLCYGTLLEIRPEGYLCPSDVQTQADVSCSCAPIVPNGPCSDILPCSNHFDNASAQTCNTSTASPIKASNVNESEPSFDIASAQMCNSIITSPTKPSSVNELEPRTIFLPSCPSQEEWNNILAATKCGISLAGTAAGGQLGPALGLIDIGESDDSYLFRVSLPGVKRDENFEKSSKFCFNGIHWCR